MQVCIIIMIILISLLVIIIIVTCSHPFRDRASVYNDSMMIGIIGYIDPAAEGATLSFVCPPQYVLNGSNTATCMGNGEWEPDPREVECKGIMTYTIGINVCCLSKRVKRPIILICRP